MLDFLKIAFLVVTAPLWLPFLKAMRRELRELFEEDGGLFGDDPGPIRRAAIRARRAQQPSAVVHEWLAHVRANAGRGGSAARQAGTGSAPATAPAVRARSAGSTAPQGPAGANPGGRPSAGAGPQPRSFR